VRTQNLLFRAWIIEGGFSDALASGYQFRGYSRNVKPTYVIACKTDHRGKSEHEKARSNGNK
jgi:hypothetical protein